MLWTVFPEGLVFLNDGIVSDWFFWSAGQMEATTSGNTFIKFKEGKLRSALKEQLLWTKVIYNGGALYHTCY